MQSLPDEAVTPEASPTLMKAPTTWLFVATRIWRVWAPNVAVDCEAVVNVKTLLVCNRDEGILSQVMAMTSILEDGVGGIGRAAEILVAFRRLWSRHAARIVGLPGLPLAARILRIILHETSAGWDRVVPFAAVGASIFTHSFNYLSFGLLFQFLRRGQVRGAR